MESGKNFQSRLQSPSLLTSSPVILGCLGLVLSAAYEAQREGAFLRSFDALNWFIQFHLDAIAWCSALCGVLGIVSGFWVRRYTERKRSALVGILLSIVAVLWSMLFLPL